MKKGFARWLPRDEPIRPEPFGKIDYLCGLLVLFVSFGVYLLTLTPTVGFHDSGELITVAYTLGIAHPPGYPLYTLLGNLFVTLIPIGNIAYRMNMESALFASIAVMMTYFITLKLTTQTIPSIVASLILAFSATFWEQAVIAEKYTLNAFFFTLLIFILLKWQEAYSLKLKAYSYLYLFSFLLGLSFCHHFQTVYLVPGSIFFILATLWNHRTTEPQNHRGTKAQRKIAQIAQIFSIRNPRFAIRNFLKMCLLFVLPLTLWVYLPLRASQDPLLNWGDPETLQRFLEHVSCSQYRYYFSSSIKELIIRIFTQVTQFFPHQFTIYLVWIGIIGLVLLFKQRRKMFIFFTLLMLTNILFSIRYSIINIEDYYIPSFVVFGVFFGYGMLNIMRYLKKYLTPYPLLLLLCILPIIPYNKHLFYNNRRHHFFAYDYKINILKHLKPNAILFTEDDNIGFPLSYLYYCEREREDIDLISTVGMQYGWYAKQIKHLHLDYPKPLPKVASGEIIVRVKLNNIIHNNINSRPIYVFSDTWVSNEYGFVPEGMCRRVVRYQVDNKKLYDELEKSKIEFKIRGLEKYIYKDWRTKILIDNYATVYYIYGGIYGNIGKYDKAVIEFQSALKLNPNSANIHYNLGRVYKMIGKSKEANEEFSKAIELDSNNIFAKQMLEAIKNLPVKPK